MSTLFELVEGLESLEETEETFICAGNGGTYPISEVKEHEGEQYSEDYYHENFGYCDNCGTTEDNDTLTWVDVEDVSVCERCMGNNYFNCDGTNEIHPVSDEHCHNGRSYCGEYYNEHYGDCENCGDTCDRDDLYYSDNSGETLCSSCYNEAEDENSEELPECRSCYSFEAYTIDRIDRPLSYCAKPNFDFFKNRLDSNDGIFLGIELEMNFPVRNFAEINDATRKYFPKRYIFKNDSSIGQGAELVLAPCTYKSLCEVNFKEYFKEIIKEGATSYESGKCGLHIHISENSNDNYALNQIFYAVCYEEITKFSKRTDSQISQWASIGGLPEFRQDRTVIKNGQRYRAVNWTENTLEFRAFRGTLDYRRFKSTLQLVQASQDFLKTIKLPTLLRKNILDEYKADYKYSKNKIGWTAFRKYLKSVGQYRFLENYLNSQNL